LSFILGDIEHVFSSVANGFASIGNAITSIPSEVGDFFKNIGAAIFGAFAALGRFIRDAWDDFIRGLAAIGSWFYDALEKVAGFFEWIWHNLVSFFDWLAGVIWNALVTLAHWIFDAFNAVAGFIVQHINQTISGIDSALYGLWCNFRGKLQAIITANVTEVLVYKSIESAATGRTQLRGIGDWIWFLIKIAGAPFVGQLAAYTLNQVLPQCTSPTGSFVGQFAMPAISPVTLSTPSLPTVPAPSFVVTTPSPVSIPYIGTLTVGFVTSTMSLDVLFTYSIFTPSYPPVVVPLSVSFTYSTSAAYVTSPTPLSYTVSYTTAYGTAQYWFFVSAAVPLGVALSYAFTLPPSLSTTNSLQVVLTYEYISPPSISWTNVLDVSLTYEHISPSSASWADTLGVSLTYEYISPSSVSWTDALGVSYVSSP